MHKLLDWIVGLALIVGGSSFSLLMFGPRTVFAWGMSAVFVVFGVWTILSPARWRKVRRKRRLKDEQHW